MSVYITVAGVEKSPLVDALSIVEAQNQQTTCEMTFLVEDGWRPAVGAAVEVYFDLLLRYAGTVDTVAATAAAPGKEFVTITCLDHTAITGRRLAGEYAWTNTPAGTIIEDIAHRSLADEDLYVSGIQEGPVIEAFQTDYQTVDEAWRQVAALAGWVVRITPDRVIRFHPPEFYDAPFSITAATAKVRDLNVEVTRERYANRVIVRLEQGLRDALDTFTDGGRFGASDDPEMALNGGRREFDLSNRAHSIQRIALNGVGLSFGEYGAEGVEWWWTPGSQRISFVNELMNPPGSADTLEVTYKSIERTLAQRQNVGAIAERQAAEGGSGIYEVSIEVNDPISVEDAGKYAQSVLDQRSALSHVATYQTSTFMEPESAELTPGLRQFIQRSELAANGYYLIRRVSTSVVKLASGVHLQFSVEAVKGPIVGDSVDFFRALAGEGGPPAGLMRGPESPDGPAPVADVTGLAATVRIRRERVLIEVTGTAPQDERFTGASVFLEIPAVTDPDPLNPALPGEIYPQGVHPGEPSLPGQPKQWLAPLDLPVPPREYLNGLVTPKVKWIIYAAAKASDYENRLVRLEALSPALAPPDHSPVAVVEVDFTDYLAGLTDDDELGEVITAGVPEKIWQASGDLRLRARRVDSAGYVPPYVGSSATLSIGQFLGVEIFWEQAGEPKSPFGLGSSPYTGNPQADPPDNLGEVDVMIPRGRLAEGTHFLHLRSYGETRRLGYRQAGKAARQSYWEITITQQELDDAPSIGVTPGAPSNVIPLVRPGARATSFFAGVRQTPPDPLGSVVGYEFRARIRANSDGTGNYYPADGSWVPLGGVEQGSAAEYIHTDEWDRDTLIVYLQVSSRAINDRREPGVWVDSATVVPILPAGPTAGQSAVLDFVVTTPDFDPRSYGFAAELTPPSPLGSIRRWGVDAFFYDAETGGAEVGFSELGPPRDIEDLEPVFGPFPRPAPPHPGAWAQLRGWFEFENGGRSDYFWSIARRLVAPMAAPAAGFVNESTGFTALRAGVHTYGFLKKVRLTSPLAGVTWLECDLALWADSARTNLIKDWHDVGGLDPGEVYQQGSPAESYVSQETSAWPMGTSPIYARTRIRARNADGAMSDWVESATITIPAAPGLDLRQSDPVSVGPGVWYNPTTNKFEVRVDPSTIVTDGSGRVTMSAMSVVNRLNLTGFFSFDHTSSLKLDTIAANSLLGGNAVFLGTMIFTQGSASLTLSGSSATLTSPGQTFQLTSGGATMTAGGAQLEMSANWVKASAMIALTLEIRSSFSDTSNAVQLTNGTSNFNGAGVSFNCPVTFNGSVTGLNFSMIGGSLPSHSHSQGEVTGLVDALAGKASTTHNHDGVYAPAEYYAGQSVNAELYSLNQRVEALENA